jgi:threonine dehydrogenase-like Zn-dependent dehydrogenase
MPRDAPLIVHGNKPRADKGGRGAALMMKSLTFVAPGRLRWDEVARPRIVDETDAIVRPLAIARCDLDRAVLRGEAPFRGRALHALRNHLPRCLGQRRLFRNAPFMGPYPFGHESVGEIVEVGANVRRRVGDRVVVPFQIACGACDRCEAGLAPACRKVPPASMYGFGALGGLNWGGTLSDFIRVPFADMMLVPLPEGIAPASVASAGDNIADGYRTVADPLRRYPQAEVLIVGGSAASIGLYAVQCAIALGASRVVYLDSDSSQLRLAESLGAESFVMPTKPKRLGRFPITVDASADPLGLSIALLSTDHGGVCTSTGIYYTSSTPFPLLDMYATGVTFITGRIASRKLLPEVLGLVASGKLTPEKVTTRVASFDEAAEALMDPSAKVVITV